jgi:hypothetical protein
MNIQQVRFYGGTEFQFMDADEADATLLFQGHRSPHGWTSLKANPHQRLWILYDV